MNTTEDKNTQSGDQVPNVKPEREYEKSGCYPEQGKPFRMWALFGWLTLVTIALAGAAALLNFLLLDVS